MVVITLVTASLVTITVDYKEGSSGPLAELGRAALSVVAPMQDAVSKAFRPVSHFFAAIADLPSLRRQNEQLHNQVRQLQSRLSTVTNLEIQNEQYRTLFNLKQTLLSHMQSTGADVIGSGVSNFEWSVTIDKGSGGGVKVNDPVVAPSGLVGRVIQVTPTASKVLLIVDPDSRVAARLEVSRETGLLQGAGNQDLSMSLVNANTSVQPNE